MTPAELSILDGLLASAGMQADTAVQLMVHAKFEPLDENVRLLADALGKILIVRNRVHEQAPELMLRPLACRIDRSPAGG